MKKAMPQPQIIPIQTGILQIHELSKDLNRYLGKIKSHDEIKMVYFGTPEFSAYILEKLIEFSQSGIPEETLSLQNGVRSAPKMFTVVAVVTNPDKLAGRKPTITPSAVSLVARKHGIPVLTPVKLNSQFISSHLSLLTSDLFIVASYGKIIPQTLLDVPKIGSLNVHGSVLPKYRGASPIQTAILNGDKKTGVTIMLMDEQIDHGSVISTKEIRLSDNDTYQTLSNKMAQVAAPLLIDTMVKFVEGKIKPRLQKHTIATYCQLIKKEDGYFNIQNPPSADQLDRMIRAYYPWPGVWTFWSPSAEASRDKEVQSAKGKVKRVVKFLPASSHPELDSGSIKILLQMEGKKVISLNDFLNGYPNFPIKDL